MAARRDPQVAAELPVARCVVDVPLPHLDRLFDYLVPASLDSQVVVGGRIRVRFSGKLHDAFVVERTAESDHPGRLAFVERVIDSEPVLTPEILELARIVARRWAGTLADVLRLAVPPRAARPGSAPPNPVPLPLAAAADVPGPSSWERYSSGPALLEAVREGRGPRAIWTALPGQHDGTPLWAWETAEAVRAAAEGARGALVVVPETADLCWLEAACQARLGPGTFVALSAELAPAERYRRFLAALRGEVRVVVGTRAAVFAPVRDLGLIIVWDDGNDLLAERRAPYPHARDVALLRAHHQHTAIIVGGYAVTPESARLLASGWARAVGAPRTEVRRRVPRVVADQGDGDRWPQRAWRVVRAALRADRPVLVQVPRRGHLPALACGGCRVGARCPRCAGPLAVPTPGAGPACRWCGELATDWRCAACGHSRLRAVVVGAERTADELGRAFPGVPVRVVTGSAAARGETVRDPRRTVPSRPTLVVATPGAEPLADGGYGAGVLLDGWVTLARPSLRAAEEAVRRWLAAAALVRPDGTVLLVADGALPPVQAVVRWAPEWFARRELDERTRLLLPPASVFAEVCGPTDALRAFVDVWQLPAEVELFGPVDVGGDGGDAGAPPGEAMTQTQRLLVRAPRKGAAELADSLATAYRILSARKLASGLRLRIDPIDGL